MIRFRLETSYVSSKRTKSKHTTNSMEYIWCDYENLLIFLLFHTSIQIVHIFSISAYATSLFDTQSLLLPSSPTDINQRSNQFSVIIDSCWYGSDYVTNVIPVSYTSFAFQPHQHDSCWLKKVSFQPLSK